LLAHESLIEGAAMYPGADGILATLNAVINSNGLLSALFVALVVAVIGGVIGGLRRRHERARYPARFRAGLAVVVMLALVFGVAGGVALANRALTPAPTCAQGKVDFDGSTAFAPIMNEVATEYQQDCPEAQVTINAVGSAEDLAELAHRNNTPVVAMSDGLPQSLPGPQYVGMPVGVIIFAVVGNRESLPPNLFTPGYGGGMSPGQIAQVFEHPVSARVEFVPVGRPLGSGTRTEFSRDVLHSQYASAGSCPRPGRVCDEATTLGLLTYVNDTKHAIGYAEDDALPFFPSVAAIPISIDGIGYEPTRLNTLNGDYSFYATEYLYTNGIPGGLEADVIDFLMSKAVAAQLRDTSFISCSDLHRSNLSSACPAN
jgi:phosphate transport system substrate-binding protein